MDGTWRLAVGIAATKGAFRYGQVGVGRGGNAAHPRYRYVEENVRITPQFHQGGLELRVETVRARLTSHQLDGGVLRLAGRAYLDSTPAADAAAELVLERRGGVTIRRPAHLTRGSGGLLFSTEVPLELLVKSRTSELSPSAQVGSANDTWEASLVLPGLPRPVRIVMDDDVAPAAHPIDEHFDVEHELLVDRNGPGHLRLQDRPVQPVADTLAWTADDAIALAGRWAARRSAGAELVLRARGHHEEHVFPLTVLDGRFEARIAPAALSTPAGMLPLRAGSWDFRLRHRDAVSGVPVDVPVRVAATLFAEEPTRVIRKRAYELTRRHLDQLFLFIDSELDPLERGPYRLKQLRQTFYQEERRRPLRQAVLYDAYTGKQFSDSPRAVLEELQRRGEPLEHLWIVRDQQVELPEG
ncbi:hypothetical protein ACFQZC_20255 [Streptacidiphilus monticola]